MSKQTVDLNRNEMVVSTYRGYVITKIAETNYSAAGTNHGSIWSAICYIDELLTP